MLFLSVPIEPGWGDGTFQRGRPPQAEPWRKKAVENPNQDLVSASWGQRPVAKTRSLQKVRWVYTYLTSADSPYSHVFSGFTYIKHFKCTFCTVVKNIEFWVNTRHSWCLSMQKREKVFVCLISELQVTTQSQKADSGLIRLSLAIFTILKAKNCKYKHFVQTEFLDLNSCCNSCVWEEYIYYIHIHTQQINVYILYKANSFHWTIIWGIQTQFHSLSETADSSGLRLFLNIKTNYPISLPINPISIPDSASVVHLSVVPLQCDLFTRWSQNTGKTGIK